MVVVSGAVTFTLTVLVPTLRLRWKSAVMVSASVRVLSDPSRYSTVAVDSLFVSVIVTWLTEFATVVE